MGSVIQCFSCTPMPEPVPVIWINIIFVLFPGSRSLPQIQIKTGRNSVLAFPIPIEATGIGIPALSKICFSNRSVSYLLYRLPLITGQDLLCFPIWTFLSCLCAASTIFSPSSGLWLHGFSTYTCFPACQASNGSRSMPMVRSSDHDCINGFVIQDPPEIVFSDRSSLLNF